MDTPIVPQKFCSKCQQYFPATTEYWHKRSNRPCGLKSPCKQCSCKASRDYYEKHPEQKEKIRVRMGESYAKNPELHRQRARDYARAHSAQAVARNKKWAEENPEQYKTYHSRRSALERSAEGDYTLEDLQHLYTEQDGKCAYCGMSIYWNVKRDIHIDHIHPISRGGSNWPDNLCLCCLDCNCSKSDSTLTDWQSRRGW